MEKFPDGVDVRSTVTPPCPLPQTSTGQAADCNP